MFAPEHVCVGRGGLYDEREKNKYVRDLCSNLNNSQFFGQYRIVGHSSVIDINLQVVKDSQSTYLEQSCVCDAFQTMLSSILSIALLYNL